jgi:hypothetical protein
MNIYENVRLAPLLLLPIALLISPGAADAVIIISVIIFVFFSIKNNDYRWFTDKFFILFLIIYIYLILNFFISKSHELSFSRAFGFIRFPLFAMAIKYFFLNDFKKIKTIIYFWTLIIILVIFDTLIQFFFDKNILGYPVFMIGDVKRLSSFLNKEYKIAAYLLIFCFIIFSYFVNNKKITIKIFSYVFLILSNFIIYLTGERSNFFIFFICSLVFLIFSSEKKKIKLYLVLFFLFLIFFFIDSNPKIKERYFDKAGYGINTVNKNFKNNILDTKYGAHYITAYNIFKENPIFGSGIKTFRLLCADKKFDKLNSSYILDRCSTHPHNIILEILSELGLVGLFVIFFSFFFLFYERICLFLNCKNNFLLGLICVSVFFYFPLFPRGSLFNNWNSILYWICISLLITFDKRKIKN